MMRLLAFGILFALLMGCASPAAREASRKAWEDYDLERARECRGGAAMQGSCIGGGGP